MEMTAMQEKACTPRKREHSGAVRKGPLRKGSLAPGPSAACLLLSLEDCLPDFPRLLPHGLQDLVQMVLIREPFPTQPTSPLPLTPFFHVYQHLAYDRFSSQAPLFPPQPSSECQLWENRGSALFAAITPAPGTVPGAVNTC